VRAVFADTSGFYAALDTRDAFHAEAKQLFHRAEVEKWRVVTTNYIVHETWSLAQSRLGGSAVEAWLDILLPLCEVEFVDPGLHEAGAARRRQHHLRQLSLTDCVSFELMSRLGLNEAIAQDKHFASEGIALPASSGAA